MDSSDEISDNILSYLVENATESDVSLLDVNPLEVDAARLLPRPILVEPVSPSVRSSFSSRRLEWDSGADVGYIYAATPSANAAPFVAYRC